MRAGLMLLALFSLATATVVIYPTDPDVRFIGRHKVVDQEIQFDNPGCEIRFTVSGATTVSILFRVFHSSFEQPDGERKSVLGNGLGDLSGGDFQPNWFYTFVDGVQTGMFNTSLTNNSTQTMFPVAGGLNPGKKHDIRVFKITEAQWNQITVFPNYITFSGIVLDNGRVLPPKGRLHRLEFVGDSITAGFCNMCQVYPGLTSQPLLESFWHSWPNLICEALDADCHTEAWSGYGVIENCCGGNTTMPMVYQRTLATVAENDWVWQNWIPDAVIINLGTNDGSYSQTKPFYDTYHQMLLNITQNYGPNTHIFLACGPMETYYCPQVFQLITAMGASASFLDQRNILNSTNQCCGHPAIPGDITMAQRSSAFIKTTMGW